MDIHYKKLDIKLSTPLIVAISGGPDSVALLHLIHGEGFQKVIVAHLDHQIRTESQKDAELVKKLAEAYGYRFELRTVDVKAHAEESKENLEACGRTERYRFFRELKKKHNAQYIVTAHHADDQIETVLMNIIRGCGLEGLAGMKNIDGDIWRPLLSSSKQELLEYCQSHELSFIQDVSNDDLHYRRNFLRAKVVPYLKELNPNLVGTMKKNIRVWQQADDYLQLRADSFLQTHEHHALRYDTKAFLALESLEQQTVLRSLYERIHGNKQDLIQDHLEQVLKVIRTNVSGKQKEFGSGKVLARGRGWFEVRDV